MNKAFYSTLIAASMLLSSFSPVLADPAVEEPINPEVSAEEVIPTDTAEEEIASSPTEEASVDEGSAEEIENSEDVGEAVEDTAEEPTEDSEAAADNEDEASDTEASADSEEVTVPTEDDVKAPMISGKVDISQILPEDEEEPKARVMNITSTTYKPFTAPTANGYFEFYEDFSEMTANPNHKADVGLVSIGGMLKGDVLAERPDGVKWSVSGIKYNHSTVPSVAHVDLVNDRLHIKGGGDYTGMLHLNMEDALSGGLEVKDIPQEYQELRFKTNAGGRSIGMMFFINSSDNTYIWIGTRNGETVSTLSTKHAGAFVAFMQGGTCVDYYYDTSVTGATEWTISVENGMLKWKAQAGANVWENEAPFDENLYLSDLTHLAGVAGSGDNTPGYLHYFQYKTGAFYTPEITEPDAALYADVMEKKDPIETVTTADDGDINTVDQYEIYELDKPTVIRRIEFSNYVGTSFGLSVDGVNWDEFTENNGTSDGTWTAISEGTTDTSRWVNTKNTTAYKYVKTPIGEIMAYGILPSGIMSAYENISLNAEIDVRKKTASAVHANDKTWYLSEGSGWTTTAPVAVSDDINYISTRTAAGKVTIRGEKETYTKDTANTPLYVKITSGSSEYIVKVSVKGPLSDLNLTDAAAVEAYVATQQGILDNLNTRISSGSVNSVKNFFTALSQSPNVNELDAIDAGNFVGADEDYAKRIMTYGSFNAGTTLEGIEDVCDTLTREMYVGKLNDLHDDSIQKKDENGQLMYEADGTTPILYTVNELMDMAIENNRDLLELPVDNKYYKDAGFASKIRDYLVAYSAEVDTNPSTGLTGAYNSNTFTNQQNLQDMIDKATVMTVLKNSDSAPYLMGMIDDYRETLGFTPGVDDAKIDEIMASTNAANTFAQSLNFVKSTMIDPSEIKGFIDSYAVTAPAVPQGPPVQMGNTSSAPSGGRPSGGTVVSNPGMTTVVTPIVEHIQPDNTVTNKGQIFGDVPVDYWGYEAIRFMHARQAVTGYGDGNYLPENPVTKAEVIRMILGIFDPEVEIPEDYVNPFTDITEDLWFYNDIVKANVYGIFAGTGDLANANDFVTRQEMMAIVYRAAEKTGKTLNRDNEVTKFADDALIADWAYTPIAKLQAAGVVSGYDGRFDPLGNTSRAAAAQVLYMVMQGFEAPVEEVAEEAAE